MTLVEVWFEIVELQSSARGVFKSVKDHLQVRDLLYVGGTCRCNRNPAIQIDRIVPTRDRGDAGRREVRHELGQASIWTRDGRKLGQATVSRVVVDQGCEGGWGTRESRRVALRPVGVSAISTRPS